MLLAIACTILHQELMATCRFRLRLTIAGSQLTHSLGKHHAIQMCLALHGRHWEGLSMPHTTDHHVAKCYINIDQKSHMFTYCIIYVHPKVQRIPDIWIWPSPSQPSQPSVLRKLHVSPERWTATRKRHQTLPIVQMHWVRLGATGSNWELMFQRAAEMCRFDVLTWSELIWYDLICDWIILWCYYYLLLIT